MNSGDALWYFRASIIAWIATFLLLAADIAVICLTNLSIIFEKLPLSLAVFAISTMIAIIYSFLRFDAILSSISNSFANIALFSFSAVLLSYIAAYLNAHTAPWDPIFERADKSVGLDWLQFAAWLNERPTLAWLLDIAYGSLFIQGIAVVCILAVLGHHLHLQRFVLGLQITAISCCLVSAVTPALGVYHYLGTDPAIHHPSISAFTGDRHIADLLTLKGAAPVVRLDTMTGIVVFPSFHAAVAILIAWALWRVPYVRWVGISVNVAMIVSTPFAGGHYFVDVPAGLAAAFFGISGAARIVRGRADPLPASPADIGQPAVLGCRVTLSGKVVVAVVPSAMKPNPPPTLRA